MRTQPDILQLQVDRAADLPVGAQLARTVRELIRDGALRPGDRLPSVRELAAEAGVNVNTARAVYGRLEHEGLVRSEHGRGTFVAGRPRPEPVGEAATRRELRRQIAELEAELVSRGRRPPDPSTTRGASGGRLTTAAELSAIRDELMTRLQELDAERAELLRQLAALRRGEEPSTEEAPARRSSLSLRGARVRWVGV